MSTAFVIALDGPSGTGKSTVARAVARAVGAGYLDTGALYRVVTLAVLRAGVDPGADEAVAALLPTIVIAPPTDPDDQQHLLAGDDVSARIRDADVTAAVSAVAANPVVRSFLLGLQREIAHSGRMVVEGRDIGTVIAPDAPVKIYLTADPMVRAARRRAQDAATGADAADVAAVEADLARRDAADSRRATAPLAKASDAVVIDSTALSIEETVAAVVEVVAARGLM